MTKRMNSEKLEYTGWLYFIGLIGLILGVQGCILCVVLVPVDKMMNPITIVYAFLLLSAVLFLFVRREMTYLMYTGMFAILSAFRTFVPLMYPPIPKWTFFIGSVPYWLCLGYLIYKYFDFRKIYSEKTVYETRYEEPYKKEKEVKTEPVPYYYRVLGVSRTATHEEIKDAYRRLAKIFHPDVSADQDAEKKFKEIQKAYEVLSDPDKRVQYDMFEDSYSE